jgi:hypothetical protein
MEELMEELKDVGALVQINLVQFFVPLVFEACFKHPPGSNTVGNRIADLRVV